MDIEPWAVSFTWCEQTHQVSWHIQCPTRRLRKFWSTNKLCSAVCQHPHPHTPNPHYIHQVFFISRKLVTVCRNHACRCFLNQSDESSFWKKSRKRHFSTCWEDALEKWDHLSVCQCQRRYKACITVGAFRSSLIVRRVIGNLWQYAVNNLNCQAL